jgi:uncharacterized protein (DUF2336 family)
MIVRQFLQWMQTAPAGDRAEASGALARAYLYSDLSPDDRAAAEGALLMLLDDPSPRVRRALADAFASSPHAPPAVVLGLAEDQPYVARPILENSPLLLDTDLIEVAATARPDMQVAIAGRRRLPRSVAAAIAEVGTAEACLVLVENPEADIVPFSFERIVERHGHLAAIREALTARPDLPMQARQALVVKLSQTLANFAIAQSWMDADRAHRVARDACEKATLGLAADPEQAGALLQHLRQTGQLTAGLLLRALLSGNLSLFEAALADLSGVPHERVGTLVQGGGGGFRALYARAGLPDKAFPAFREAVAALAEGGFAAEPGGVARLKRRVIERVLAGCEQEECAEVAPLLTLLRRYATEAAREEARLFCHGLVAGADVRPALEEALAA